MSAPAADYRAKVAAEERFVCLGEGRYRLEVPEAGGVTLDLDRLRRESGALVGELVVRCNLPGALTLGGILSAGDVNLSSVRARQDRGKYLSTRARVEDIDFVGMLEELALRVIAAEREGSPAVLLRDIPRPPPDEAVVVDGLPLLPRHPITIFGDGGAAKSYLGLYLAGRLEQMGLRVGLFDWELAGEDHRDRLERLFGSDMPGVVYARCSRPLVHEADRLQRIAREKRLDFAFFDSVAFACDGPPEAAEVAARYFQALRQFDPIGSLHIAHISKADGSDQKPFGSAFWHNGSRATWFAKLAEGLPASGLITIGLFNRKANLGALRPAIGYEITFTEDRTSFRRVNPGDTPDLAVGMTVRQRIAFALRGGSMTVADLARDLDIKADTIEKTIKRAAKIFTYIPGTAGGRRVGLRQRES